MKKIVTIIMAIAVLASCASMKTVKSNSTFYTDLVSEYTDPRLTPIILKQADLPAEYATNGKYAACKMSFTLVIVDNLRSPRDIKIEACDTNDTSDVLKNICLKIVEEWQFSLKPEYRSLPDTERYTSYCGLKG